MTQYSKGPAISGGDPSSVVTANQGSSNTASNGWPVKPTDGVNSQSFTASGEAKVILTEPLPGGTNSIGSILNIIGSVSLPTGAATSALQSSIIAALGSPFQAGGSIANTSFAISGTLPAYAATPTFNLGTLNGAATDSAVTTMSAKLPATLGQKSMASSMAVTLASDQSAVPTNATLSAETTKVIGTVNIASSQSIISNIGTTNGLALDATLTGGSQKAVVRGGAKGTTTAADVTSVAVDANTQALHINVTNFPASQAVTGTFWQATQPVSGTFFQATQPVSIATMPSTPVTGTFWQATQPISAASLPLPTGAAQDATLTDGTARTKVTDGTNNAAVKAASTAVAATDPALVVAVSPNNSVAVTGTFFQGTQPVSIATMPSTPVTNTGTFAVQAALNAETTKVIGTVNVAAGQSIAVTNAGTFATQSTLAAETTKVIGTVNIAAAQTIGIAAGSAAIGTVGVTSLPALVAGSALIGKVGIDQTTPGTTNGVQVNAALPAGTNVIGKVSIDQTTPGTTNLVQVGGSLPTGANTIGAVNIAASQTIAVTQATAANLNATAAQGGTWTVQPGNTANTTPWLVAGNKTNNAAVPGATNYGTLPGVANASPQTWTEGNQVALSADLAGNTRILAHPMNALGFYSWGGTTGTYGALAANTPLFSMRWSDATKKAVILKVEIQTITTVAATTAGITERQLIVARSFTVSDTGGTAATLTGNNQKRRTSQATSVMADLRIGNPLTAGTRTLDSAPMAVANAWTPLNFTGITIGGTGGAATGAAWSTAGCGSLLKLLDAINGQDYPIVLAANEGIVVRIGVVMPTGATQQTFINVIWAEVATDY